MKEMLFLIPALMSSLGYAIIAFVISFLSTMLFLGIALRKLSDEDAKILTQGAILVSKLVALGVFLIKLF